MKQVNKKIAKGIYLISSSVFFRKMINGKRVLEKAPVQGALALDNRGAPTKELKKLFKNWEVSKINEKWEIENSDVKIPTFRDLIAAYENAANEERIKNDGRPKEKTVRKIQNSFEMLVKGCKFELTDKISKMDSASLERYFVESVGKGMKRISAWTYIMSAKSVTAKWALAYYRRIGMAVKPIEVPKIRNHKGGRYERPNEDVRREVAQWYEKLWELDDKRLWMSATLMLQFAMRNSDAKVARWSWFKDREGTIYLRYVPEKTKNSSGRHVMWPVHQDVWRKMQEARKAIEAEYDDPDEDRLLPRGSYIYTQLNASLRDSVPALKGSQKASYELRKLRIDAEYRRYGAERASALSGDAINTITYYYADVADVAAEPVKAEELIL